MLAEGLGLMAAGMGMVFAFLILLVFVMTLSARLFSRFPDSQGTEKQALTADPSSTRHSEDRLDEVAAAVAAVRSWLASGGRRDDTPGRKK
ncbi:MAG TPA: OadG family protein [Candidatus Krumholzibacterium sp.]|nr:OadG family protein [Candidatus Krumholzibacterium sp.]